MYARARTRISGTKKESKYKTDRKGIRGSSARIDEEGVELGELPPEQRSESSLHTDSEGGEPGEAANADDSAMRVKFVIEDEDEHEVRVRVR